MAKRRGHGEGSIRQRKDGRWEGRYTNPHTKKRDSIYADTQRACKNELRAIFQRLEEGKPAAESKELLRVFLARWLETVIKVKRAHKTWKTYSERVAADIDPYLGDTPLSALTTQQVETWLAKLQSEVDKDGKPRLAASTIEYDLSVLRSALNTALKWELVWRNVAALVEAPHTKRPRTHAYTVEEAQQLIKHMAGTRWEPFYRVAIGLGLRMSELIYLRWADVDLVARRLTVYRSKSRAGERTINLPEFIIPVLEEHHRRYVADKLLDAEWNPTGLVFPSEAGTPMWAPTLRTSYKRHARQAKLERVLRFHDLRHTCASYLLNQGVPIKQVSEILGHAQASTTANIYWHIANETQRGVLDKNAELAG